MKQPQVKDRFGLVYIMLVILGVGTLLPWNVFITEKEFFDIRLHVEPSSPLIANNFISLFGLVFNSANLIALCFIIFFQQNLSLRTQILNPLILIFIVLASTAALTLQLDLSGITIAYYSLPALAVLGIAMAVLQGGLLNLASLFPPIYIQGYIVGAGLSGCATSLMSLVSQLKASSGGDSRTPADVAPAALLYFGGAAAITALCCLSYSSLTRLKYSRAKLGPYLASRAAAVAAAADRDLLEQLLPGGAAPSGLPPGKDPNALPSYSALEPPGPSTSSGATYQDYYHSQYVESAAEAGVLARDYFASQVANGSTLTPSGFDTGLRANAAYDSAIASGDRGLASESHSPVPFMVYALSIILTMGCSLAVWPGVTAFICSVDNPATVSPCAAITDSKYGRLTGDLFVPMTFLVFGIGDVLGRIASSLGPWGRRPPAALSLLFYALLRFGIAAAIMHCHVITPAKWRLPSLFDNDLYPLGFITMLGLSQGHLLSTACMHAPALVPPGKEGEFGPVTGFCITAGCLLGSGTLFFIMKYFQVDSQ